MKWILKKLIVALVGVLVVMGLADAIGIDLEGLVDGLFGDEEESTGAEESSSEEESSLE